VIPFSLLGCRVIEWSYPIFGQLCFFGLLGGRIIGIRIFGASGDYGIFVSGDLVGGIWGIRFFWSFPRAGYSEILLGYLKDSEIYSESWGIYSYFAFLGIP